MLKIKRMVTAIEQTSRSTWTAEELKQLASLSDTDLKSWMDELSSEEQRVLLAELYQWETRKPRSTVQTREQLGESLGLSLPTIRKYIRLGMCCDAAPFDVDDCRAWVDRFRGSSTTETNAETGLVPARIKNLATRTKRDEIAAESEQIELELKRGALLLAESVEELFREVAATSVTILDGIEDAIDREMPEKCPSEDSWKTIRERSMAAAKKVARDVLLQMERLISNTDD